MSRHDGDIEAAGEVAVELEELLAALGGSAPPGRNRQDALAQYLSGEEGWRDARKALRGTFAGGSRQGTGLTGNQDK